MYRELLNIIYNQWCIIKTKRILFNLSLILILIPKKLCEHRAWCMFEDNAKTINTCCFMYCYVLFCQIEENTQPDRLLLWLLWTCVWTTLSSNQNTHCFKTEHQEIRKTYTYADCVVSGNTSMLYNLYTVFKPRSRYGV